MYCPQYEACSIKFRHHSVYLGLNMAGVVCDSTQPRENQCAFVSEVIDTNCPNCFVLKEQLEFVTQELKSARTIISLLKEESNSTCVFPALDSPLQSKPSANTECHRLELEYS